MLPFTVTVLVPAWLARRNGIALGVGETIAQIALQVLGALVLGLGVGLFASSLTRFATEGDGTLAPWDPPRRLVVRGPYRHVRNPMISGVVLILLGEAATLRSGPHFLWALIFLGVNAVYIPLLEEPFLKERFGNSYPEYCRNVPRLIPRRRPWEAGLP